MNISNLLHTIKIQLQKVTTNVLEFITNPTIAKESFMNKLKLSDCLTRTRNAYYSLTGFKIKDLITKKQLEDILLSHHDTKSISEELKNSCSHADPTYIMLLLIAITNVYKPTNTPVITGGLNITFIE